MGLIAVPCFASMEVSNIEKPQSNYLPPRLVGFTVLEGNIRVNGGNLDGSRRVDGPGFNNKACHWITFESVTLE